ncbi:DUF1758 domain-containing protein [Trichonephila clavata]|uniref:DUF1758 domain-containing protein n=1 Tax=Trichonephila clavata TaxID=2740835 RepID=A0A8X6LZS3_TRICU|nr:DUF1758 domain-containing protein [Trichonephila clavata]
MAKGVKILERKFSDIEKQLSGFIAFVDTFVEDDKEVLSFKLSQFDRLNAKYESVKEEIFNSLSDGEFKNFDGKITTCNEHIEKLEVRLKSLNLKYSKNNNETGSNAVSNVVKPCFRLPELSLPQFNGDIETWFIFNEKFKEIIENCGLNDKKKLQYLQSCLIGIAKHVQTVDDTYDSLFLALEQRFENKRLIINKHINALLMLKYEKFRGDSNVDLRNLVDTCTKHLRALKLLKIEHNTFSELLLIQLVMQVLDTETKRLFEMTLESTDIPKWDDFLAFLNKRCLFLENLPSVGTKDKQNFKDSPRHKSFILHTDANVDKKCKLCSLNHDLYNCDKFKNMPVRERYNIVKFLNLCLKCLKPNHKVSQCRSKHICFCKKNHNQLLHFVNVKNQEMQNFESSQPDTRRQDDVIEQICFQNSSITNNQNKTDRNSFNFPSAQSNIVQGQVSGVNMSVSASQKYKNDIILSTCIIYVENSVGEKTPLRVLADSGLQVSLLRSSTADFLNLRKLKTDMSVSGLGGSNVNIKSKIKGVISNGSGSYKRVVDFHVVPKITNMILVNSFDISHIVFPSNVYLADPTFNTSNSIDALLSADIFFDILKDGADDITTAKEMQRQLIGLMKEGCFHLYKWSANCEELLKDVPTENKEFLFNENDQLVKTLGLSWRPREDTFMYQMNLQEVPRYVAELHQLKDLKIPRCILLKDSVAVQLIGFADASAQAYGACLYVKSENANETQIRLLCSKTRVAPLKTLSIPRLELLAATLLSKLTSKIIKIIDLEFDEVHLFSDSKVVLDWIQMQPHLLKVFVANRVSLIQELTETFS